MYKLEFTENKLPPTTNGMTSMHWTQKKRLSDEWNNIVMFHVLKLKAQRDIPLQKAKLTLIRYSSYEPDYDGLVSSFKVPLDALRHNGIIADDKMQNVGIPTYLWERAKPGQGKIKVCVEEINE